MSLEDLLQDRMLPLRAIGYDRGTVDGLLRATAEAIAALVAERDELRARLAARLTEGTDDPDPASANVQDIQDALLAAIRIRAEATRTSELVLAGARHQARMLLAEAQRMAEELDPAVDGPADAALMLEDVFQRMLTSPTSSSYAELR